MLGKWSLAIVPLFTLGTLSAISLSMAAGNPSLPSVFSGICWNGASPPGCNGNSSVYLSGTAIDVFLFLGSLLAVALISSVNFLGSGLASGSNFIIVVAGGFLAMWVTFSVAAITLINTMPYGTIFYAFLSLIEILGIIVGLAPSGTL